MNTLRSCSSLGFALLVAAAVHPSASGAVTFTNDTLIGVNNPTHDGEEIVVSNCTLTVNGAHAFSNLWISAGGVLTHSPDIDGWIVQDPTVVSNELHILTGTNAAVLTQSYADTATIVVSNELGTLSYSNQVDYEVGAGSSNTVWIQRLESGSIPDGGTVLVSYTAANPPVASGLGLAVTGDVTIENGGAINVNGRGYGQTFGPGRGGTFPNFPADGGGGGHGGYGGMSSSNAAGGLAYDSTASPADKGSPGGMGVGGFGGTGGGAIKLTVGGTLRIDGGIFAKGYDATNARSGGGAGGSIWLSAATISGTGAVSAEGGLGEPVHGGGGGGGRIAVYAGTNTFAGTLLARGGLGFVAGGAGSIYIQSGGSTGVLTTDNGGRTGAATLILAPASSDLAITGAAIAVMAEAQTISNLFIAPACQLLPPSNQVTVLGNVVVQNGGVISADGRGELAGAGPGKGQTFTSSVTYGGGGGHGGYGASGTNLILQPSYGGQSYGSPTSPVTFGSGGGGYRSPLNIGGLGGGAIRLVIAGTLSLDGVLSANGTSAIGIGGGGGSGGSIWLTAGAISGSGSISANGGDGISPGGGGGGGGRVALEVQTNGPGVQVTAYGGNGSGRGGAGTIYRRDNAGDPIYENQLFIVDNGGNAGTNTPLAELTSAMSLVVINRAVGQCNGSSLDVANLLIGSNSVVCRPAGSSLLTLNVGSLATIESGGGFIMDGVAPPGGSGGGTGSTGGGHGGYGGEGTNTWTYSGIPYGTLIGPVSVGSSGAPASLNGGALGGSGGGAVRMTVGNELHLDGSISANGRSGISGIAGGGSGGSIWLTVGSLSGSGAVSANGGSGRSGGGGGAGGRIAVIYSVTNRFTGSISACGGVGYENGGAGTMYTKSTGSPYASIVVDNAGVEANFTPVSATSGDHVVIGPGASVYLSGSSGSIRSLTVLSNAVLSGGPRDYIGGPPPSSSLSLMVMESAAVQAGGVISFDGLGNLPGSGSGPGLAFGTGAGHGGYGAGGKNGVMGGSAYGQVSMPTTLGSGGHPSATSQYSGGTGGGAVRLTVLGQLTVDGMISANGSNAFSKVITTAAGGGAGGSVWLTAGTFAGSGVISVNGGAGVNGGGGGGGGRIAIYYGLNSNLFSGSISAFGGIGYRCGGAGTIHTRVNNGNHGLTLVNNGDIDGTNTLLAGTAYDDLTVTRGGRATWVSPLTLGNVLVTSNGWLTGSNLTAATVIIDAGGGMVADGQGYSSDTGTGRGQGTGGGGGHGGLGGANPIPGGGSAYGSILSPSTAGSGGDGNGLNAGGAGGGVVRLQVAQELTVNGRISADGAAGSATNVPNSGGGAGGSVWLTVGTLSGSGAISANGGSGWNAGSGGGGGGRIALYYHSNNFAGILSARGGNGSVAGGAGTIYEAADTDPVGRLLVNNGGLVGTNTPLSTAYQLPVVPFDLTVGGGASVYPASVLPVFSNITVAAGGKLTSLPDQLHLWLAVQRDVRVEPGGAISVRGAGYAASLGPGNGRTTDYQGSGGGHGGIGGESASGALGGTNYDSVIEPANEGSGGGFGNGPYFGGSEGGGTIRLSVGGNLNLEGSMDADGNAGLQDDSGGGAGGSIWITAGTVSGGGALSAKGGSGDWYGGGGGGGGRIAIYSPANTFTGLVSVAGGAGASPGGDGTIWMSTNLPGFQITSSSPEGIVSNIVSYVEFNFNDVVSAESASVADFGLIAPDGPVASSNLTVSLYTPSTVRVSFPALNVPGEYHIEAGPDIQSLFGQAMSQVYTGAYTVVLPTISGTVTDTNGSPVAGVLLDPGEGLIGATTDAEGHYELPVPRWWAGTVTPSAGSLMFVPGRRVYTGLAESVVGEDYLAVTTIAAAVSARVDGTNLLMSWHGLPGVAYQVFSSTNLVEWLPYGAPMTGSNAVIELPVTTDADPQRFFRIGAGN